MAGRPRAYVREDVLERAMSLFWAKGFEGSHLAELVNVTGLNRFSLYKEFGGKEGLFREALALYLARAEEAYDRSLAAEPLGLANIIAYFRSIRFGADYHGCLMINTLGRQHVVTAEAFEMARKTARRAERLFLNNLRAARESGELSADRDPKEVSRFLAAFDQGLATYGIVEPKGRFRLSMIRQVERLLGLAAATAS